MYIICVLLCENLIIIFIIRCVFVYACDYNLLFYLNVNYNLTFKGKNLCVNCFEEIYIIEIVTNAEILSLKY